MAAPFPNFVKTWHQKPYEDISPTNPQLTCSGKVVFITGGGAGLGKHIALAFAEAQVDAVFIVGRTESTLKSTVEELRGKNNVKAEYFVADILSQSDVNASVDKARSVFGRIDIMIHNAAYLLAPAPVEKCDMGEYWQSFEINVRGGLYVAQAFLKIAKAGATFINISSAAAHIRAFPGFSAYSCSKMALAKIFEFIQAERPDLRVFSYHPGAVATAMAAKVPMIEAPDSFGRSLLGTNFANF